MKINRDIIWKIAEPFGLRPVAMISVDDTWSAMLLKIVRVHNMKSRKWKKPSQQLIELFDEVIPEN